MAELEARIAALEAERGDHRVLLAAIDALGGNQRDLAAAVGDIEGRLGAVETGLDTVETTAQDTNVRLRSLEDGLAEFKDLLVRVLSR